MKNKLFSHLPLLLTMALMMPSANASAQGTVEDYNRAYAVSRHFQADSVYNWARYMAWCDSSHVFHYQISTPQGMKYISYNADKAKKKTYDSYEAMRKALGIKPREAEKPQFGRVKQPHWMEVDEEDKAYPVLSPDGKTEAYIEGYNVVVHEAGKPYTKAKRILTQDGTIGKYYSNRIQWSPDGKYILVCKRTPVEKRYVYYVESSPADQLQPILHKQEYAKPGDMVPQHYPVIIDVATGKKVEADPHKIENQYELEWLQWTPDSKEVTMEYNQRGHHLYQMLAMNAETGALRVVVEEKANTFVNYSRLWRKFINNGKQLLWTSERDNWNHLYLYDVAAGKLIRQITKGEWFMRKVLRVDEEKGEIYFSASGVNKNEDPYFIHCYKINMDGSNMIDLTPEEGTHSALFSYDFRYLVDTYSKIDTAPVTVLRDARDGKLIKTLETADLSKIKEYGWRAPEVFVAKGRDGKTDMWGMITRPTNFDPNKKYPIIEYIYSGPGDAYTPKNFRPHNWTSTSLAELGFIVVQLDAMGTSYRGKKFEEICYKNLKDAGLPDRILWIKEAAKKYPYMDINNVGIYGMSAGGQESTTAVLTHGDFYKAAYSSCGCHDNRMDKIWWNEQWMSWPIDSSYVESSNVEMAHRLERPLMLVLGEIDDNVDPSSTYQLVNALIKANKEFEFVIIPGADHTMGEDYGEHKRYDFFVKNLLGVDPPKWNLINSK
mgnify:FL=1